MATIQELKCATLHCAVTLELRYANRDASSTSRRSSSGWEDKLSMGKAKNLIDTLSIHVLNFYFLER